MRRRELIQGIFVSGALLRPVFAAVRGDDVMYIGGTMTDVPDKTEGRLDLTNAQDATFSWKKGAFSFAYKKISSLEYGQKAGRRVGVALAVSPLFLLSKKRKHFLTIGFTDDTGAKQGAVLEIGKGQVRNIIAVLEARSGRTVEYESEEAKKHVGN